MAIVGSYQDIGIPVLRYSGTDRRAYLEQIRSEKVQRSLDRATLLRGFWRFTLQHRLIFQYLIVNPASSYSKLLERFCYHFSTSWSMTLPNQRDSRESHMGGSSISIGRNQVCEVDYWRGDVAIYSKQRCSEAEINVKFLSPTRFSVSLLTFCFSYNVFLLSRSIRPDIGQRYTFRRLQNITFIYKYVINDVEWRLAWRLEARFVGAEV